VVLVDLTTLQCQRSRSDKDGRYRFAELKPGKYQVLIGYRGFETKARVLKVKPGKTAEFSPELQFGEGVKLITTLKSPSPPGQSPPKRDVFEALRTLQGA
jgi:hypothetical protein